MMAQPFATSREPRNVEECSAIHEDFNKLENILDFVR